MKWRTSGKERPPFAFRKVFVDAGASVPVTLCVPLEELGLYDENMQYVLEPGDFQIMVGPSSEEIVFSETVTLPANR